MGLMDVLHGMANGPHGPAEPGRRGGISPITMGLLALLAYKTMRGEGPLGGLFFSIDRRVWHLFAQRPLYCDYPHDLVFDKPAHTTRHTTKYTEAVTNRTVRLLDLGLTLL